MAQGTICFCPGVFCVPCTALDLRYLYWFGAASTGMILLRTQPSQCCLLQNGSEMLQPVKQLSPLTQDSYVSGDLGLSVLKSGYSWGLEQSVVLAATLCPCHVCWVCAVCLLLVPLLDLCSPLSCRRLLFSAYFCQKYYLHCVAHVKNKYSVSQKSEFVLPRGMKGPFSCRTAFSSRSTGALVNDFVPKVCAVEDCLYGSNLGDL